MLIYFTNELCSFLVTIEDVIITNKDFAVFMPTYQVRKHCSSLANNPCRYNHSFFLDFFDCIRLYFIISHTPNGISISQFVVHIVMLSIRLSTSATGSPMR